MAFAHPEFLVATDWLAERLADDDVRLFEKTVFLHLRDGRRRIESGRREYEAGHIPGSGFLDLQADFSNNGQPWRFMMPRPAHLPRRRDRTASWSRQNWSSTTATTAWGRSGRRGCGGCSAQWAAGEWPCWTAVDVAGRPRAVLFRPTRPRLSPRRPIRRASLTLPRLGRTSSWEMGAGAA